jgi:hypothetical protein
MTTSRSWSHDRRRLFRGDLCARTRLALEVLMMTIDEEMDEDDRVQILMALRNWAIALAGPEKTSR